jgi:uncharacterized repeat protein (TIGR01451 family)
VVYRIVVTKSSTGVVTNATVTDALPPGLTSVTWTCTTAGAGSSCGSATGSGSLSTTVTLGNAATSTATFLLRGIVAPSATGTLTNAATVTPPPTVNDPSTANNTAIDTDTLAAVTLPALTVLDTFNRANATTLNNGTNWSQNTNAIRVNGNTAFANNVLGTAYWNNPTAGFGIRQAAAFTFANAPVAATGLNPPPSLVLKATGGSASTPVNYIRVSYQGGNVTVATTALAGLLFQTRGTLAATFAVNDVLTAVADGSGNVFVFKNSTAIGVVSIPISGTGSFAAALDVGRIGIHLPNTQRIDNFAGGNV